MYKNLSRSDILGESQTSTMPQLGRTHDAIQHQNGTHLGNEIVMSPVSRARWYFQNANLSKSCVGPLQKPRTIANWGNPYSALRRQPVPVGGGSISESSEQATNWSQFPEKTPVKNTILAGTLPQMPFYLV